MNNSRPVVVAFGACLVLGATLNRLLSVRCDKHEATVHAAGAAEEDKEN